MHKTISYVIYTVLSGYSDIFQYRRPVKLISFCVKTNTFYKLTVSITYILSILQALYYSSQEIRLKNNIFK